MLYGNRLIETLYSDHFGETQRPANAAEFMFVDLRAREFFVDWETAARMGTIGGRS